MRPSKQPFPWSQNHHRQTILFLSVGGGHQIRQPAKLQLLARHHHQSQSKQGSKAFICCCANPSLQIRGTLCAVLQSYMHVNAMLVPCQNYLSIQQDIHVTNPAYVTGCVTKPYMTTQGTNLMAPHSLCLSLLLSGTGK